MAKVRISFVIDDDIWGFLEALSDGIGPDGLQEVALEDAVSLIEAAEDFTVSAVDAA